MPSSELMTAADTTSPTADDTGTLPITPAQEQPTRFFDPEDLFRLSPKYTEAPPFF